MENTVRAEERDVFKNRNSSLKKKMRWYIQNLRSNSIINKDITVWNFWNFSPSVYQIFSRITQFSRFNDVEWPRLGIHTYQYAACYGMCHPLDHEWR